MSLELFENFIESRLKYKQTGLKTAQDLRLTLSSIGIAQILSRALSSKDTEKLLESFDNLKERLRQLSMENLKRLEQSASKRRFCKHKGTCLENCLIKGLLRSFIITYGVKYGLGFIPSLLTGKIFKSPELIWKLGGRDTTSFALFMAFFISSYKGVLCSMRHIRKKNDWLNAFVAGTISGFSILLDRNETRRIMIALYLSTRTFHFIGRYLWRHYVHKLFAAQKHRDEISTPPAASPALSATSPSSNRFLSFVKRGNNSNNSEKKIMAPPSPKIIHDEMEANMTDIDDEPSKHHHWRKHIRQTLGTITMAVSSSQILYAYVCEPDSLARSYLSFLLTHGGIRALQPTRARQYLNAMGATIHGSACSPSSKMVEGASSFRELIPPGLPVDQLEPFSSFLTQTPHEFVMCAIQHPPTSSCTTGAVNAFVGEWRRAFALYAPLNLIMTIIFRGKKILKSPWKSLKTLVTSTLRSVLFLTCYVTMAWSLPCLLRNLRGKDERWMYYVNGILAGSCVLIEQPGRRLELGMYCLPRAIESLWNSLVTKGMVRNVPYGESLYFSLATGILMTFYQQEPGCIHKTYRDLIYRMWGLN